MCDVIAARSPNQKDNFALLHAQALQPQFTVAFTVVFSCDHWIVKNRLQIG